MQTSLNYHATDLSMLPNKPQGNGVQRGTSDILYIPSSLPTSTATAASAS